MPGPIAVAVGVGAVALWNWACEKAKKTQRTEPTTPTTPTEPTTPTQPTTPQQPTEPLPPERTRSRYAPPAHLNYPEATPQGVLYHTLFKDGQAVRSSFPVGLRCDETKNSCDFSVGTEVLSFSSRNLEGQNLPLEPQANFFPEVDGQNTFLSDFLVDGSLLYASYGGAESGIAIRDFGGNSPLKFLFPADASGPDSMLLFGSKLAVSISNYTPDGTGFNEGKVFILRKKADGSLEAARQTPFATLEKNPQPIVGWNANGKAYLLAVNAGHTTFTGEILSDSGVDVIDLEQDRIVGHVPLGRAAANTITISEDNAIAFLGSQSRPFVYTIDLKLLAKRLADLNPETSAVQTWGDVPLADAQNPIRFSPEETALVASVKYDNKSKTLFVSSFNDGKLYRVKSPYTVLQRSAGVVLDEGFGEIQTSYVCAKEGTQFCSELTVLEKGVMALTGQPASVTFIPNSILGRR